MATTIRQPGVGRPALSDLPGGTESASAVKPASSLLFVVGLWRSGTSLVQALLNRHPLVALMYEAEPFGYWPVRPNAMLPPDWPRRLEFYNQTFSRHHLDPVPLAGRSPARQAALALYGAYAAPRGAAIAGEKAPAYYASLPAIARVFPEARFLVIWRDPIECCRSAARAGRQNPFFAQRRIVRQILFGAEALALGVERLQREGQAVHQIEYNEFVDSPEPHLRALSDFLRIPFDSRMLDLAGADCSSVPEGQHHERVRSGIIARRAGGEDPLSPGLRAKARRYTVLWRGRFAKLGFAQALRAAPEQAGPGPLERWADQVANWMGNKAGAAKRWCFRWIPLKWWRRLAARSRP